MSHPSIKIIFILAGWKMAQKYQHFILTYSSILIHAVYYGEYTKKNCKYTRRGGCLWSCSFLRVLGSIGAVVFLLARGCCLGESGTVRRRMRVNVRCSASRALGYCADEATGWEKKTHSTGSSRAVTVCGCFARVNPSTRKMFGEG